MQLHVISNKDNAKIAQYKIARAIYAETGATSLRVVEAMASMIANIARLTERAPADIAADASIFESQKTESIRHVMLDVDASNRGFEMCLRVVGKMLRGNLPDSCCGATRFHRTDIMPDWATARGYIAEIDNILFYL